MTATAKPRLRRSRTVSKYFSIHSVRPGRMQTVPRRPAGGAKRANRKCTPSGVFNMPVTASSGTGLAGMETSFIGGFDRNEATLIAAAAQRHRRHDHAAGDETGRSAMVLNA